MKWRDLFYWWKQSVQRFLCQAKWAVKNCRGELIIGNDETEDKETSHSAGSKRELRIASVTIRIYSIFNNKARVEDALKNIVLRKISAVNNETS